MRFCSAISGSQYSSAHINFPRYEKRYGKKHGAEKYCFVQAERELQKADEKHAAEPG